MFSGAKLDWFGDKAEAKSQRIVQEFLWLAGQDMITQSVNNVPLDTGTLRRSGVVTMDELPNPDEIYSEASSGKGYKGTSVSVNAPPCRFPMHPRVFVSYNTPYAIRLHEDPHWLPRNYKYTRSGKKVSKPAAGTWKWLEKAIPKIERRCGAYLAIAKRKAGIIL